MTTYNTFKPSVQFLEAGEKGQQFANTANTFKPLLSQEAGQSIEGIDKVSQAFTATGRALEHFGFDEAEPESTPFQQLPKFAPHSMIEELPSVPALPLDDPEVQKIIESLGGPIEEVPESTVFQSVINELPPSFFVGGLPAPIEIEPGDPILQSVSQYIKQAGFDEDGLQEAKQINKIISQGVRTWKDYNEYDPSNPRPTIRKIEEAVRNNDTKAVNRFQATPITTAEKIIHEETVNRLKDPNVSTGEKIVVGVIDAVAQTYNGAANSVESAYIRIGDWTGWWDEMEPDVAEGSAYQGDLLTGITANDENVGCSYVDKVTRPGYCEEMEKNIEKDC